MGGKQIRANSLVINYRISNVETEFSIPNSGV